MILGIILAAIVLVPVLFIAGFELWSVSHLKEVLEVKIQARKREKEWSETKEFIRSLKEVTK